MNTGSRFSAGPRLLVAAIIAGACVGVVVLLSLSAFRGATEDSRMPMPAGAEAPAAAAVPTVQIGPTGTWPDPNTVPVPPAGSCHAQNGLPDHTCTPGASNPDVTAATLNQTICNPSWHTTSIRPPVSYTGPLKLRLMASYGVSGSPAEYELDHLIPLEDGGAAWSPLNLWPQARAGEPNAGEKDQVETATKQRICAGQLQLDAARAQMAYDWTVLRQTTAGLTAVEPKDPEP